MELWCCLLHDSLNSTNRLPHEGFYGPQVKKCCCTYVTKLVTPAEIFKDF